MTIFWKAWGPLVRYRSGTLFIEDLNPEIKTKWTLSRGEMLRFGWRCMVAAVRG
jgi:hypothetical protein